MKMYQIIYNNKDWNGKCVKYGFKRYIEKRLLFMMEHCETYEVEWVLPLQKDISNFKKCWKKYFDVLEKFSNIY